MKSFTDNLLSEVEANIEAVHQANNDPLRASEDALRISIVALKELRSFFLTLKTISKAEEIIFFRDIKPKFTSKLIHYNDIYNIETRKPIGSQKIIRKYYSAELGKLETYFRENSDFYKYYRSGNRYLDNKYFVRGKHDIKLTLDSFYLQADQRFSTSHEYKVAMILANEATKIYLDQQLFALSNPLVAIGWQSPKQIKWTGSKVALVELIYALHTEGVFGNGTSDLKEVATLFETAFNVDLGQFNRTFLEIRARKFERTKFLNNLKDKLIARMDTADNN